jgi:diguanylate cyclase (GGDEF)-like protein
LTDRLRKNNLYSKNQSADPVFCQRVIPLGIWVLVGTILLLLAFFSSNTYIRLSGLGVVLAGGLYLFFFRVLILENKFKKIQQENLNRFTLFERLEEATSSFLDRKNKEKLTSFLLDFFSHLLHTKTFLLFLRDEKGYKLFDLIPENAEIKKKTIKTDEPLISFLKRQPDALIFDLGEENAVKEHDKRCLPSGLKGVELKSALPLKAGDDLIGFVLFSSNTPGSPGPGSGVSDEKQKLLNLVAGRLLWLEGIRGLKLKLQRKRKEYLDKLSQGKISDSLVEAGVKRKIFDLHSLFQSANQLYLSLDQNRLFFNFTQTLQRQLSARSVLIFLPEEKGKGLKARYSKGVDFLQYSELRLEEEDPLYKKFKGEQTTFYLYQLIEEFQGNELLARTIGQGFQVCFPLNLLDNQLGLVFLSGRSEGIRYKEEDFLILSFLSDVLNVSLKNITQYKILEELSYTDSLSGLYNNRYFCKRLNEEIFRAKRYQRKLALVIFDIDEFKIYNDSFGHQSGDQIIRQLGELIVKVVRSIDVVCRYGGDEFCVIMPETDQEECLKFIERLRKHILHHSFKNEFLQLEHHLTLSAGAAIYPQHARTSERLIYCADMVLLKAKSSGKNKAFMYNGEDVNLKSTVPF